MLEAKLKPVFLFIWRFLFTFMSLGYLIYVLVSTRGTPHPDTYGFFVWVFIWAIVFDSGKMKARAGTGEYRGFEKILTPRERYPGDPNIVGTPTYLMNLGRTHHHY